MKRTARFRPGDSVGLYVYSQAVAKTEIKAVAIAAYDDGSYDTITLGATAAITDAFATVQTDTDFWQKTFVKPGYIIEAYISSDRRAQGEGGAGVWASLFLTRDVASSIVLADIQTTLVSGYLERDRALDMRDNYGINDADVYNTTLATVTSNASHTCTIAYDFAPSGTDDTIVEILGGYTIAAAAGINRGVYIKDQSANIIEYLFAGAAPAANLFVPHFLNFMDTSQRATLPAAPRYIDPVVFGDFTTAISAGVIVQMATTVRMLGRGLNTIKPLLVTTVSAGAKTEAEVVNQMQVVPRRVA